MKITHFSEYNSIDLQKRAEFLDQLRKEEPSSNYERWESKLLSAGTKILVVGEGDDGESYVPETLVELVKETKVKAYDFGEGLSCDNCLVLDDGSDELLLIGDEPSDITDIRPNNKHYITAYTGPKHGAKYILHHN
ncbi:MAG: hypothetical protein AABY26_02670 [Nanoarchaeota archaeon]